MAKTYLFNDFEAFSRVDLPKSGVHRYVRDRSTKALMLSYAFDREKVQQWVPAEGEKMPRDLRDGLRDPDVIKSAWNAPMEMGMWKHVVGEDIDFNEWRCSMVRAMTLSFPGSLAAVGPIVDIPHDKQKDAAGKRLIRRFCMPQKPTKKFPSTVANHFTHPDEWEEFKEYNLQDTDAERSIHYRTIKWDLPEEEWHLWVIDQIINERGIPINREVVERAMAFADYIRNKRYKELRGITGVENPRSVQQLLEWLKDNGYRFDDLKKGHVTRSAEDEELDEDVRRACEIRIETAKTSVNKYAAMQRSMCEDDVVRGALQFAAAQRTWRWGGRLFQPHNLPRPTPELEKVQEKCVEHLERLAPESLELLYDKPMDFLATCLRPTIQAPKGKMCISADLNAIENRVLGWLADDQKILDVFRDGRCPYVDFATYMYGERYDDLYAEYKGGDKSKRTVAKPAVLGCGYMLSAGESRENRNTGEIEATGLLGYAWNMGVKLTPDQAKESVRVWRATFTDVVEFWWEIEAAAKKCLRTGKETHAGHIGFDKSGPFMRMILPSGRCLHYCRPRLEQVELFYDKARKKFLPLHMCKRPDYERTKFKESITYEGLNDKNKWTRIQTHPGKLVENADQAVSRDLLAHGMLLAEKEGIPVRLHVHDEIVGVVREREAEEKLRVLIECMKTPPRWGGNSLPLGAEGTIGKVWMKD